jgi:hypothetical protein
MGNDVPFQLTMRAGAHPRLKLTGESAPVGTLALARAGFTLMELKKVE